MFPPVTTPAVPGNGAKRIEPLSSGLPSSFTSPLMLAWLPAFPQPPATKKQPTATIHPSRLEAECRITLSFQRIGTFRKPRVHDRCGDSSDGSLERSFVRIRSLVDLDRSLQTRLSDLPCQ